MGGKRGHTEGGIYKHAEDDRWVGSLSLGYEGWQTSAPLRLWPHTP
jgi:hypothetical protein